MATPDGRRKGCIAIIIFTVIAWAAIIAVGVTFWRAATPHDRAVQRCIDAPGGHAPDHVAECWSKR